MENENDSDSDIGEELLVDVFEELNINEDEHSIETIKWEKNIFPLQIPNSNIYEGPTIQKSNLETFRSYFDLFFPFRLIELLVEETNRYAVQKLNQSKRKSKIWKPVVTDEIYAYIGCKILMGISNLPEIDHYWLEDKSIGSVQLIQKTFARNRFEDIDRSLHCVNNKEYIHISYV